jgi:nucleoside diphosphate kinase
MTGNPSYLDRTLGLLKPEALLVHAADGRPVGEHITERIEDTGLVIAARNRLLIPQETAMKLYDELEARLGPEVFRMLVGQMTSGEAEALLVYGPNAPWMLRKMAGESADPQRCSPGTIRFDFSAACSMELAMQHKYSVRNMFHAANPDPDPARVDYELGLFFTPCEMDREAFRPPESWRYRFPGAFRYGATEGTDK